MPITNLDALYNNMKTTTKTHLIFPLLEDRRGKRPRFDRTPDPATLPCQPVLDVAAPISGAVPLPNRSPRVAPSRRVRQGRQCTPGSNPTPSTLHLPSHPQGRHHTSSYYTILFFSRNTWSKFHPTIRGYTIRDHTITVNWPPAASQCVQGARES